MEQEGRKEVNRSWNMTSQHPTCPLPPPHLLLPPVPQSLRLPLSRGHRLHLRGGMTERRNNVPSPDARRPVGSARGEEAESSQDVGGSACGEPPLPRTQPGKGLVRGPFCLYPSFSKDAGIPEAGSSVAAGSLWGKGSSRDFSLWGTLPVGSSLLTTRRATSLNP